MDFEELKEKFVEKLRKSTLYNDFFVHETPNSVIVRTKSEGIFQKELTSLNL